MNFLATIMNVMLFGFTCLVLLTDGISREVAYILLTLLLLLVPIFNLVMIFLGTKNNSWFSFEMKSKASEEQKTTDNLSSMSAIMKTIAVISNIVLFGFSCWAIVDQYPHPKEDGIIIYTLLVLLTPILSSLAIFHNRVIISQYGLNK